MCSHLASLFLSDFSKPALTENLVCARAVCSLLISHLEHPQQVPHSVEDKAEAWRGQVTHPKSLSYKAGQGCQFP